MTFWLRTDLRELPTVIRHGFDAEQGDAVGVDVTDQGEPVSLAGSVKANIILPNGTTIKQNGTKSANRAWITLPDEVFATEGHVSVFLKILNGNETATLGGVVVTVRR